MAEIGISKMTSNMEEVRNKKEYFSNRKSSKMAKKVGQKGENGGNWRNKLENGVGWKIGQKWKKL